ncbi:helix-turn-helix domain-containing protein [Facklamia hominis]|nr:helix-turn-helix domain-containing protein [Facklamia hominis]
MRYRLLSQKAQRQLHIIKIFYDPEVKAVSTRQLAKMIGCSLSILLKDLEEIETLYDQELTLKREDGQVYIVIHTDYTYGYFFQSYAHACSEFMILDTLFKRQINTMDEAAEIFYMSRTSLSRAIQRINKFFTDLEIPARITKSPLKLDMSETVYRTYYPLFLDIYYSVDEWLCKDVTYQEVLDFFLKVSDHSNFIEFYMKNPFIYLRLAINMQRTFEGSLVAKGEWPVSDTKLEHILKNIPEDKR